MTFQNKLLYGLALISLTGLYSCDDFETYPLPEANSIADETPPQAGFTFEQQAGLGEAWKDYFFTNTSSNAIMYTWDFGDGNTSTEVDPTNTYPGEGMYTVSLIATDGLGVSSTFTETIEVIEPEAPLVADPVLINADFDRLSRINPTSNTCTCAGWINRSVGDQGESSGGNGGSDNVVKYDNYEPDATYQEFEVVPNADYTISIVVGFQSSLATAFPSALELRILAGTGYDSGYTPTYYSDTTEFPEGSSGTALFGYTSIPQVEDPNNNQLVEVINHPGNTSYNTYTFLFNSGANNSLALYMRGIGGPSTGGGGGDFGFNSGDEEIRVDSVSIIANN